MAEHCANADTRLIGDLLRSRYQGPLVDKLNECINDRLLAAYTAQAATVRYASANAVRRSSRVASRSLSNVASRNLNFAIGTRRADSIALETSHLNHHT